MGVAGSERNAGAGNVKIPGDQDLRDAITVPEGAKLMLLMADDSIVSLYASRTAMANAAKRIFKRLLKAHRMAPGKMVKDKVE